MDQDNAQHRDSTDFNEDQNPSENWEIASSSDQWESCIGLWWTDDQVAFEAQDKWDYYYYYYFGWENQCLIILRLHSYKRLENCVKFKRCIYKNKNKKKIMRNCYKIEFWILKILYIYIYIFQNA